MSTLMCVGALLCTQAHVYFIDFMNFPLVFVLDPNKMQRHRYVFISSTAVAVAVLLSVLAILDAINISFSKPIAEVKKNETLLIR